MNMQELEDFIRSEDCTPIRRIRYHQEYIYAARRHGKRNKETYIAAVSQIGHLTPDVVREKLDKIKTA